MKKFDANKFLQIIKSKNSKDQYDNYIPNILDKVFDWKKNLRNKYMCPKNFGSLHKYFKKIDKKIKYETIFNAYDDLSVQKEGKWFFELGIISHQTNKKILFVCVYSYATKYDEPTFDIEKKYRLKKYPDKMKMMNMIYDYLDGDIYFPKTIADELHQDDSGVPINGSWGSVLNFSYKLELKPQKTVFHPLYYYSHPHRQRIEKSFLSYPHTKINYEFGKKRK